jgi:hypothetical protein
MSILEYFLKIEPNYALCIVGFLVSIVLLFFTVLFVKEKLTFNKENGLISDKPRFFTKFLGVLFILSLSFAANNAFVYIISIIIIEQAGLGPFYPHNYCLTSRLRLKAETLRISKG